MTNENLPADQRLSRGPWKVESVKPGHNFSGENWMIANLGEDHNDVHWYITTDCVPASMATSEPEADARAIVEWRNSLTSGRSVWQPIDTAPKDGRMLLTVVAGYKPGIFHWFQPEDGEGRWAPDPESFNDDDDFGSWLEGNSYHPTHWMPIPKGPTQ